jgi:5-oxoprolinase (ATP-hydrolysing)
MRAPMLSIHTVAAGGGSILVFDGSRYRVGPDSAGADPGPASYRRGGPLTVTDANVMLGRVQPGHFPRVFGPGGDEPLDAGLVAGRFAALARRIADAAGDERSDAEVAAGFLDIAVANMANAIKKISVQRGYDITRYVLATFGGAGGQHACAVADALGITEVLIHPLAGVLSAYGMGLASVTAMRETAVEAGLSAGLLARLDRVAGELEAAARAELEAGGVPGGRVPGGQVPGGEVPGGEVPGGEVPGGEVHCTRRAQLRYQGTDTSLTVPFGPLESMMAAFEAAYRQRFSFLMPDKPVIVEAVSVEVTRASDDHADELATAPSASTPEAPAPAPARVRMFTGGAWAEVDLLPRSGLRPGRVVRGPALITEDFATTVVEPGWQAGVTGRGDLLLTRPGGRPDRAAAGPGERQGADPVMLEIFNNLFMSVAEQMGVRLQSTAHSVNIKERLDFSCAVFDAAGQLIANAPHMPVHLGSMGESIRMVISRNPGTMKPGDVFMLNDPYHGGTHLPDITVVTPVFADGGGDILFYVASRGHHAEIGGITPGSMPAFSTRVDEEGVLIDNWRLAGGGEMREAATTDLLTSAEFPSRNPGANLADLRAQIAANEKGVAELRQLVSQFGLDVVTAYMGHVQDNAEESVRRVIARLRDGECAYELDNGAVINVAVRVDQRARTAEIDFTGTSAQLPGNFNAPSSVAMAAVLYVLRTLVDDEIPLNAGCLKPVRVIIPPGSLLAPAYPAAVAAGNVETSQAVTGALYAALGVMAEGSGTMNNVTFGSAEYQYYETVASGSGAGEGFGGASVVQTHMTNSRLTDPEVLEWRFPVRLESFEIRRGSGGAGHWPGGDGGRRRLRFLTPMTVSTLSSHRRVPPYGMAGGSPGQLGRQWVERADGQVTELAGCDRAELEPGDVFVLETPGGGGYGPASRTGSSPTGSSRRGS